MTGGRANVAERRLAALALRREGHAYDVIAGIVGVSKGRAWSLVQEALAAHEADDVALLRQLEGQRLDVAQQAIWAAVLDGDLRAVDTFIRLSARRARLFGIDAAPDDLAAHGAFRASYSASMEKMFAGLDRILAREA